MDSVISTAARALSTGDPLLALKFVALRDDGPALALRGIAMAQLGELKQARLLLSRATQAFGARESTAVARCTLARAEISLELRELEDAAVGLEAAHRVLTAKGDHPNALFARLLEVRRLMLLGRVNDASSLLSVTNFAGAPARLTTLGALAAADLEARALNYAGVQRALHQARSAAARSRVPALAAELQRFEQRLETPIARWIRSSQVQLLYLRDLPNVIEHRALLVDACRREIRHGEKVVSLVGRSVLLELAVVLASGAPEPVTREVLVLRAFGARRMNESYRARLRVEIGRLRKLLSYIATVSATGSGFSLIPKDGTEVSVLLPPDDGESSALIALLRGGEAWPTSGLAKVLRRSQRAVQRAMAELEAQGLVQSHGKGRALRWVVAPSVQNATTLLLFAPGTLG